MSREPRFLSISEVIEIHEHELEEVFFDRIPTVSSFHNVLDKILSNIHSVMKIPMNKRSFDNF